MVLVMIQLQHTSVDKLFTYDVYLEDLFTEYCKNMSASVIDMGDENDRAIDTFKNGIDTFTGAEQGLRMNLRQMFKDGETIFILGGLIMEVLEGHNRMNELFRLRILSRSRLNFNPFFINHEAIEW